MLVFSIHDNNMLKSHWFICSVSSVTSEGSGKVESGKTTWMWLWSISEGKNSNSFSGPLHCTVTQTLRPTVSSHTTVIHKQSGAPLTVSSADNDALLVSLFLFPPLTDVHASSTNTASSCSECTKNKPRDFPIENKIFLTVMQCMCNTWADPSDVAGNVFLHVGWSAGSVHGVAMYIHTHTNAKLITFYAYLWTFQNVPKI